jgi:site-specific recombinase XerD
VTRLRKMMLEELQRRNYSPNTARSYIHAVEEFAKYFHRSPDQLGPDHIRGYQVHLFCDRKLSPRMIEGQSAALRFLFVKTLRRPYLPDHIPFPKLQRRLPTVLSQEEVARLIDGTKNLMHCEEKQGSRNPKIKEGTDCAVSEGIQCANRKVDRSTGGDWAYAAGSFAQDGPITQFPEQMRKWRT